MLLVELLVGAVDGGSRRWWEPQTVRRDGGSCREEKIIVRVFVEWFQMKKLGLQSSGLLMWIQKTTLTNSLKVVLIWFFFFNKHYFGCKLNKLGSELFWIFGSSFFVILNTCPNYAPFSNFKDLFRKQIKINSSLFM